MANNSALLRGWAGALVSVGGMYGAGADRPPSQGGRTQSYTVSLLCIFPTTKLSWDVVKMTTILKEDDDYYDAVC